MKTSLSSAIVSTFFAFFLNTAPIAAGKGTLSTLCMILLSLSQGNGGVNRYDTSTTSARGDITYSVLALDNGKSIAAGSYGSEGSFIAALDGNGVEEWSKEYPNTAFTHLALTNHGDFYAVGKKKVVKSYGNFTAPVLARFRTQPSFQLSWVRNPLVAQDVDMNGVIATKDGVESLLTVRAPFVRNMSSIPNNRLALIKYDNVGNRYKGNIICTDYEVAEGSSLVNESDYMRSVFGWSSYQMDGQNETIPVLSLTKVRSNNGGFVFDNTRFFIVSQQDGSPSVIQGMVGLKHARKSDGNSCIAATLTRLGSDSNVTAYALVGGEIKPNGEVLWFRSIDALYNTVGTGVAEHSDGSCLIAGARIADNETNLVILKAQQDNGVLDRARIYKSSAYPISSAFSIDMPSKGDIFVSGMITMGNGSSVQVDFLLGRWDGDLETCGDVYQPNFLYITYYSSLKLRTGSVSMPTLYAIEQNITLGGRGVNITKDYLCQPPLLTSSSNEESGWWADMKDYEQVLFIAGVAVSSVLCCVLICCCYCECDCFDGPRRDAIRDWTFTSASYASRNNDKEQSGGDNNNN